MRWRLALVAAIVLLTSVSAGAVQLSAGPLVVNVRCGDVPGLIKALTRKAVVVNLDVDRVTGCTYSIGAPYRTSAGGLPIIDGSATIHGNGSTITRTSVRPFAILINDGIVSLDHLTVSGGGCNDTCVVGGIYNDGVMNIASSSVSGNAGPTGGIWNAGRLRLIHSVVDGNTGEYGGGVANLGSLMIQNSVLADNVAESGAGIDNGTTGTLSLVDSLVAHNTSQDTGNGDGGGGIRNEAGGILAVARSEVSQNEAAADGGGILNNGILTLDQSLLNANTASKLGGAIANESSISCGCGTAEATLYEGAARDNHAANGGAIYSTPSSIVVVLAVAFSRNTPNDCAPPGRIGHCTG